MGNFYREQFEKQCLEIEQMYNFLGKKHMEIQALERRVQTLLDVNQELFEENMMLRGVPLEEQPEDVARRLNFISDSDESSDDDFEREMFGDI